MNLDIKIEEEKDLTYEVFLAGEIDAYTAPKLKDALMPLAEKDNASITVDLNRVNYMDSTGLGVFISILKATKEHNSDLKLVSLQDRVKRLFEITGLDSIILIDSTVQGGN
ncbi:anti-sigma factor antagonist [Saliterribacillus persicus]|uniref:Anti-sigma factor antagonist n=1 Tax=Saliterribacillus persicus TaxID=930114 RepID=A0A368Y471_9BACI|nr:anti-sigma factor antagonist [Saliterribacillus persicus]RCW73024.1 anti-sigma B factor antagonist [Saliterribacillus persicus]